MSLDTANPDVANLMHQFKLSLPFLHYDQALLALKEIVRDLFLILPCPSSLLAPRHRRPPF
jgi:hypothetical protein